MEKDQSFSYQYSGKHNKEVEYIRSKYIPKEESKIDILRRLDMRVQMAGTIPGLVLGVVGCLIFGIGICFMLDVFIGAHWLAPLFCGIGALVMLPAYPVYRHISKKTKAELTPEILRLSEEIIGSQKI